MADLISAKPPKQERPQVAHQLKIVVFQSQRIIPGAQVANLLNQPSDWKNILTKSTISMTAAWPSRSVLDRQELHSQASKQVQVLTMISMPVKAT